MRDCLAIYLIYFFDLCNINGTKKLEINKNIMLDIEALSMQFEDFYLNCLNKKIKLIFILLIYIFIKKI